MKPFLFVVALILVAVVAFYAIDIRQTEDGKLPKFEVDVGSISVEKHAEEVTVPQVQVGTTKKAITVPKIVIEGPEPKPEDAK